MSNGNTGRVAVVTGGTAGIGRAFALWLAKEGTTSLSRACSGRHHRQRHLPQD